MPDIITEGPLDGPQIRVAFIQGSWEMIWKGYRGKVFWSYLNAQLYAFSRLDPHVDQNTPSGV